MDRDEYGSSSDDDSIEEGKTRAKLYSLFREKLGQKLAGPSENRPGATALEEIEALTLDYVKSEEADTLKENLQTFYKNFNELEDDGHAIDIVKPEIEAFNFKLGVTDSNRQSVLHCIKRVLPDEFTSQTSGYLLKFNTPVCIMADVDSSNQKMIAKLYKKDKFKSSNPADLDELVNDAERERVLVKGKVLETDADSISIVFDCKSRVLENIIHDNKNCFITKYVDAHMRKRLQTLYDFMNSDHKPQSLTSRLCAILEDRKPKQIEPVLMDEDFPFLEEDPSKQQPNPPDVQITVVQTEDKNLPTKDKPKNPEDNGGQTNLVPWNTNWEPKHDILIVTPPMPPENPAPYFFPFQDDLDEESYFNERSTLNPLNPFYEENSYWNNRFGPSQYPDSILPMPNQHSKKFLQEINPNNRRNTAWREPIPQLPETDLYSDESDSESLESSKVASSNQPKPIDLVLFTMTQNKDESSKTAAQKKDSIKFTWFKHLTAAQKEAVINAISCQHQYLIHGPPGTGKSSTLLAIIDAVWKAKLRVMIVTESNKALDHLLTEYVNLGMAKARRMKSCQEKTERLAVIEHRRASVCRFGNKWLTANENRRYLFEEIKHKKLKDLDPNYRRNHDTQNQICKEIIRNSRVVFTTINVFHDGNKRNYLQDMKFDYCIMDEACQTIPIDSLMPLNPVKRVVWAGDHKQLGVKINSMAVKKYLEVSFFEMMLSKKEELATDGSPVYSLLNRQFRMHSELMDTSRKLFYDNLLEDDDSVKGITLSDLRFVEPGNHLIPLDRPLIWIDNSHLESEPRKRQTINVFEQMIVARLLIELICHMKVQPDQIGVICAYHNQKNFIVTLLKHIAINEKDKQALRRVTVSTVDAFQGSEKEVIILATTRSNDSADIGFLEDPRRFNVSITRAKRLLVVVGNFETLKINLNFRELYSLAAEKGGLFEADSNVEKVRERMFELEKKAARGNKKNTWSEETSKLNDTHQFLLALNGWLLKFGRDVFYSSKDIKVQFVKQLPKVIKPPPVSPPVNNYTETAAPDHGEGEAIIEEENPSHKQRTKKRGRK